MYTKEQEEIALKAYEQLGSVHAVIRRLEYPSESTSAKADIFSKDILCHSGKISVPLFQ